MRIHAVGGRLTLFTNHAVDDELCAGEPYEGLAGDVVPLSVLAAVHVVLATVIRATDKDGVDERNTHGGVLHLAVAHHLEGFEGGGQPGDRFVVGHSDLSVGVRSSRETLNGVIWVLR